MFPSFSIIYGTNMLKSDYMYNTFVIFVIQVYVCFYTNATPPSIRITAVFSSKDVQTQITEVRTSINVRNFLSIMIKEIRSHKVIKYGRGDKI